MRLLPPFFYLHSLDPSFEYGRERKREKGKRGEKNMKWRQCEDECYCPKCKSPNQWAISLVSIGFDEFACRDTFGAL